MLLAVTGGSPAKLRIVTWMLLPSSGHANHPTPFAPRVEVTLKVHVRRFIGSLDAEMWSPKHWNSGTIV